MFLGVFPPLYSIPALKTGAIVTVRVFLAASHLGRIGGGNGRISIIIIGPFVVLKLVDPAQPGH